MSWNSNWDQTLWCTYKINILLCAHRRSWHTCMHTYAEALWRPPCFYTQVYLHANGPFRDNLITQRRFARSVPLLGENIARAEWKLHFAGANISLGLWKIPFKWSQAEKSQRICLVFCLTVVSAYTAVCFFFFRCYSTQEGPGNTDVEGRRAKGVHTMKFRIVWLSVLVWITFSWHW